MSDGPFGVSTDIGVGFSDSTLLLASLAGFVALSAGVYAVVVSRLKTREEVEKDELAQLDYDEQLGRADVATLNRAQRRARAKMIMKRQRRVAPADGDEGEDDNPTDNIPTNGGRQLSRKERQKAAKQAEKQERRLFEDERRRQQKEAQDLAMKRKKERTQAQADKLKRQRELRSKEREIQEKTTYTAWKTFLHESIDVVAFVQYLENKPIVQIDDLAERLQTPSKLVVKRIKDLISERRLTGVVLNDTVFVSMTDAFLADVAKFIKERGSLSQEDLAVHVTSMLDTQ